MGSEQFVRYKNFDRNFNESNLSRFTAHASGSPRLVARRATGIKIANEASELSMDFTPFVSLCLAS